jgi:hypothetical protein
MKYFITLTGCQTYSVAGKTFKKDQETPVTKELYDYLGKKSCFTSKALPEELPFISSELAEDINDSIVFSEKVGELTKEQKEAQIQKDPNEGVITVRDLGTATVAQHAADKKTTRGTRTRAKNR